MDVLQAILTTKSIRRNTRLKATEQHPCIGSIEVWHPERVNQTIQCSSHRRFRTLGRYRDERAPCVATWPLK